MSPKSTCIALGSNLGNQEENLRRAATELQKLSTTPLVTSSIWWSTPEGFDEEVAEFCNAVVFAEVEVTAIELLKCLKDIERQFGRDRGVSGAYQSRTLDLDIIDFDSATIRVPGLDVPHPRAPVRRFVLLPLQEVAPDYRFPGIDRDLETLIEAAPENPMRKTTRLTLLA